MKTPLSTLLLIAVLVPGCALFKKGHQYPSFKDVPAASNPAVSGLPPAAAETAPSEPAPAAVPAPEPSQPVAPAAPVKPAAPVTPAAPAAAAKPAAPTAPVPAVAAAPAPSKPAAIAKSEAPAKDTTLAKPTVTADLGLRGKVAAYNAVGKFVVLSFQIGRMPAIGEQLAIYRGAMKVGEVRITGPARDENTVGDLIAGDASAGDEVRAQ